MKHAISAEGLALIQDCEGFRPEPAALPSGGWVVGYGHVRADEEGTAVTREQAAELLAQDVAVVQAMVNAHLTVPVSQSQFDALVSFALSVGEAAFLQSQVLRRVNKGEHIAAACAMDAWRKADIGGEAQVVDALVRRRAMEKALFLKDCACEGAPSAFLRGKLDHAAAVLGAPIAFAPAPAVEHAPPLKARPAAKERLSEILKSEPATAELLLTKVVEQPTPSEEIVTAHAKPCARPIPFTPHEVPRDRRIANLRARKAEPSLWERVTERVVTWPAFENIGLVALALFGVGLVLVAGSLLIGGVQDMLQVVGALALTIPGLAFIALATFALLRGGAAQRL